MAHPTEIGGYQVLRELGRGGMGVVYEVQREGDPRRLALKLLPLELADQEAVARFQREGELMARVDHPNVVRVHDLGRTQTGMPFLVSDVVDGEQLEHRTRRGPVPRDEAVALVRELARGVARLHAVGILHRDLKPANVIVRNEDGAPVLLDFGLARDLSVETLTQTGTLLGSPATMAPEQARGVPFAELGPEVDVYGLGAILFCLLVGGPPFVGPVTQVLLHVLEREPDWSRLGELDPSTVAVLRRAMAKAPEDRYPSAEALGEDLERLIRNERVVFPGGWRRSIGWVAAAAACVVLGVAATQRLGSRAAPGGASSPVASRLPAPAPTTQPSPAPTAARTERLGATLHALHSKARHADLATLAVVDRATVVARCPHVVRVLARGVDGWTAGRELEAGNDSRVVARWGPGAVVLGERLPGTLRVIDVRSGETTRRFEVGLDGERKRSISAIVVDARRGVFYVAFARDLQRDDRDRRGWAGVIQVPVASGGAKPVMERKLTDVHDLAVAQDGTLVATGSDKANDIPGARQTIYVRRGTWLATRTVANHTIHPSIVGDRLAFGSSDGYVAWIRLHNRSGVRYLGKLADMAGFTHTYPAQTRSRVTLDPTGRWAFTVGESTSDDPKPNRLMVWDLEDSDHPRWEGKPRPTGYLAVACTPDGATLFALRKDCLLEEWSVAALTR